MSSGSSSAYVNLASPGATASFPDESTLMVKEIGQPIQKISKKKIVENKSKGPISQSSLATPRKSCLCGSLECHGAEAYETLVNKPTDDREFGRASAIRPSHGTFIEFREYELVQGPDDSPSYVNLPLLTVSALPTDESTLVGKKAGKPIKKGSEKKLVASGPISPSSPATCLCESPSCKGAEAYEALVNKPRTDFGRAPVASSTVTASLSESTLVGKKTEKPIKKVQEKKLMKNPSKATLSPSSPATPREPCVCGRPECKGREAYENLVNNPRRDHLDVPATLLSAELERRSHPVSSTPPSPSPQFAGPRRCCNIM